jgi:hypothetical protein
MSALSIQPTFPIFTETDGQPLEDGYIWIGAANLDPQGNPINVYWDAALTQLAGQPIRTQGGYPVNSGTPARLYVNSDYSIRVMNKNGSTVYSAPAATERYSEVVVTGVDAADVNFIQAGAGAVATNVQARLRQSVSVFDFMTSAQIADVQSGAATLDVSAAITAALTQAATGPMAIDMPAGIYRITSQLVVPKGVCIYGVGSNAGPRWDEAVLAWDKSEFGTVIAIDFGSGGSAVANSALYMTSVTTVQGVNFWHMSQSVRTSTPVAYPPTIGLAADPSEFGNKCFCTTITNCIFINSWIAIDATVTHENLYVTFCGISAFFRGIVVDQSTDVDKLQSLNFNNTYTYIGNFPTDDMFKYSYLNGGVGIRIGRADAINITNVNVIGYETGILMKTISTSYPSGVNISNCNIEGQIYCITAEDYFQNISIRDTVIYSSVAAVGGVRGQDGLRFIGNAALPQGLSRSISLDNVQVAYAANNSLYFEDCVYCNVNNCRLYGAAEDPGFMRYNLALYNLQQSDFRSNDIAVNPNHANTTTVFMSSCDGLTFESNTFDGQQSAASVLFLNGGNGVRILGSLVTNSTAPSFFGSGGVVTNSFAETPINQQGNWTPVLNSFPAVPTLIQQKFAQSGLQVYITVVITFAAPQTFVTGTSYITGLPVPMWDDAAFSCGDGTDLATYSSAIGIASTQRIYVPAATSVDRLIISGSYAALAA